MMMVNSCYLLYTAAANHTTNGTHRRRPEKEKQIKMKRRWGAAVEMTLSVVPLRITLRQVMPSQQAQKSSTVLAREVMGLQCHCRAPPRAAAAATMLAAAAAAAGDGGRGTPPPAPALALPGATTLSCSVMGAFRILETPLVEILDPAKCAFETHSGMDSAQGGETLVRRAQRGGGQEAQVPRHFTNRREQTRAGWKGQAAWHEANRAAKGGQGRTARPARAPRPARDDSRSVARAVF